MCFDAFPDHQNQVLKILFFHVWSGEKRVLRYFQTTRIKSLKNYFLTSGVAKKRVLMHLRILPDYQNHILKNVFFDVWSG